MNLDIKIKIAEGYQFLYALCYHRKYHYIGVHSINGLFLIPCFSEKDQQYRLNALQESDFYIQGNDQQIRFRFRTYMSAQLRGSKKKQVKTEVAIP